ncbi:mitochondrial fission 1 protein-like [Aethina tumida]|uniref:mitochondrial fission 1 protein-like n=1 Tax=Aethina tumida TaxID=116153 RepID=UPI00096B30C0|nr:mitochondrial fission 1 protein-like [Aethina tumida]
MADGLDHDIAPELLRLYESIYFRQLNSNIVTRKAQFEYSVCLVRDKNTEHIERGLGMLNELYRTDDYGQRDYIYFLALGNARLKRYEVAMELLYSVLKEDPTEFEYSALYNEIRDRLAVNSLTANMSGLQLDATKRG